MSIRHHFNGGLMCLLDDQNKWWHNWQLRVGSWLFGMHKPTLRVLGVVIVYFHWEAHGLWIVLWWWTARPMAPFLQRARSSNLHRKVLECKIYSPSITMKYRDSETLTVDQSWSGFPQLGPLIFRWYLSNSRSKSNSYCVRYHCHVVDALWHI